MSLSQTYQMDVEKENNGVEVELGFNKHTNKPIKMLTARRGGSNKQYKKAVERNTKPVRRLIETNSLSDEQDKRINATIYAESCAKGWEEMPLSDVTGNKEDENKLADFTTENVIKLLLRLPELATSLYIQSSEPNLFVLQQEEDAKN